MIGASAARSEASSLKAAFKAVDDAAWLSIFSSSEDGEIISKESKCSLDTAPGSRRSELCSCLQNERKRRQTTPCFQKFWSGARSTTYIMRLASCGILSGRHISAFHRNHMLLNGFKSFVSIHLLVCIITTAPRPTKTLSLNPHHRKTHLSTTRTTPILPFLL
jgi:hypothetical protein